MNAVEDRIIKDVLMSGFQADETTCSEAKLRFLLQQKSELSEQWRYNRHELLKYLRSVVDKISRQDIESLVQCPEETSDNNLECLEEEDSEDTRPDDDNIIREEDEDEDQNNEDQNSIGEQPVLSSESQSTAPPQYQTPTSTNGRPASSSPPVIAVTSPLAAETNHQQHSDHRLSNIINRVNTLERYVLNEIQSIRDELQQVN